MSVVQETYPIFHDAYLDGQVADTSGTEFDSLAAEAAIAFGRAVRQGAAERGVLQGISRVRLGQLSAALNNSATTVAVDALGSSERIEDGYIIINSEFMRITEVNAARTSLTAERGARQSAPAAHVDNSVVYYADRSTYRGLAVIDPRVPATAGEGFPAGELVSVLYRGDVAVKVSAAVNVNDQVVIATAVSGAGNTVEEVGQPSAKPPGQTHVRLVNARFISVAAAQGIAVMRLFGMEPAGN